MESPKPAAKLQAAAVQSQGQPAAQPEAAAVSAAGQGMTAPAAVPAAAPQSGAVQPEGAGGADGADGADGSELLSGLDALKLSSFNVSPVSAAEVKELTAEAAQNEAGLKKITSSEASATAVEELLKGGTLKPELRERFERCLIVQSYLNQLRESFNSLKQKAHKPAQGSAEQQLADISNLAMDIAGKHAAQAGQNTAKISVDAQTAASMEQLNALDHLNWADGRLPGEALPGAQGAAVQPSLHPQMQLVPPQAAVPEQMLPAAAQPLQNVPQPLQNESQPQLAFDAALPQEVIKEQAVPQVQTTAPAQLQPELEDSVRDDYQERIRRQAQQLSAGADAAGSTPSQGLSAAEAAAFENTAADSEGSTAVQEDEVSAAPAAPAAPAPLPEINASMSLEELRRINAAVDAMMRSEAETNTSPLAANFAPSSQAAAAKPPLQAEPLQSAVEPSAAALPSGQQIAGDAPSPLAGNFGTQVSAAAPSVLAGNFNAQPQPVQPQTETAMMQSQAVMPLQPALAGNFNQPPQMQSSAAGPKRGWQGRPSLSGNFKQNARPPQVQQLPDYLQDVPLPEDELPGMPEQGAEPDFDEAEFDAYAENAAQDMLLAQKPAQAEPPLPEMVAVPDTQPQESRAFAAGAPAKSRDRTRGLRPVQELPAGQVLPRFKGLKALSADDFYPTLEGSDHYYQLILKTGLKNGPDLNVLLYSELVHEPDADGVMEICCSLDHHTYVEGTGAAARLEQAFSQVYGRPVKLKLDFMQGIPALAPSSNAARALMEETAKKRKELMRSARLQELCSMLGENLNELPLTIYTPELPADPKAQGAAGVKKGS